MAVLGNPAVSVGEERNRAFAVAAKAAWTAARGSWQRRCHSGRTTTQCASFGGGRKQETMCGLGGRESVPPMGLPRAARRFGLRPVSRPAEASLAYVSVAGLVGHMNIRCTLQRRPNPALKRTHRQQRCLRSSLCGRCRPRSAARSVCRLALRWARGNDT